VALDEAGGRLCTDTGDAGISVGGIADESP